MAIIIIHSHNLIRCAAVAISILAIVEEIIVATVAVTAKVGSHISTMIHSLITITTELRKLTLLLTTTGKISEYCLLSAPVKIVTAVKLNFIRTWNPHQSGKNYKTAKATTLIGNNKCRSTSHTIINHITATMDIMVTEEKVVTGHLHMSTASSSNNLTEIKITRGPRPYQIPAWKITTTLQQHLATITTTGIITISTTIKVTTVLISITTLISSIIAKVTIVTMTIHILEEGTIV